MSSVKECVKKVQRVHLPSRTTLVVEAQPDVAVYRAWTVRLLGGSKEEAESKMMIVGVGGKSEVLSALAHYREDGGGAKVFGLVDRDDWSDETIDRKLTEYPQLRVNRERHSLESYFCDPSEIGPLLIAEDPRYEQLLARFASRPLEILSARVDHWSLFTMTERVKQRMTDEKYPGGFHDVYDLPSEDVIRNCLRKWDEIIDEQSMFDEFNRLRLQAQGRLPGAQLRECVWAKPFFEDVICGGESGLAQMRKSLGLGAKSNETWMIDLAEMMPRIPPDIEAIFGEIVR